MSPSLPEHRAQKARCPKAKQAVPGRAARPPPPARRRSRKLAASWVAVLYRCSGQPLGTSPSFRWTPEQLSRDIPASSTSQRPSSYGWPSLVFFVFFALAFTHSLIHPSIHPSTPHPSSADSGWGTTAVTTSPTDPPCRPGGLPCSPGCSPQTLEDSGLSDSNASAAT